MVELLVTYMEMTAPPPGDELSVPIPGATVAREVLDLPAYVDLYRAVGAPVQWDQRLRMNSAELARLLAHPSMLINVLRVDGEAAGLCEFSGVGERVVELTHFGLVPNFQGRRLGPFLLDQSLRAVWSYGPERLWLHTDTYDHPRAQSVYKRAGFRPYAQQMETFPD
ncbi:GNAT family N-acetyltransferase [Mesorhizobium tamadayense]|uniref:GNAT family N-acetyltransferase n=1 Tax=Mesorhizobium tamadayense TaxID=425306 RepID=A0A3P3FE51_9HYPH|nr:GNAT family N-acetyltransferase [Mesorhizobium tamadayense]RRH96422.1 GNAT family N-acetyltransferase [Mesorhizobium tamadayense]